MWTISRPFADRDGQRKLEWICDMMNGSEKTAELIGITPEAIVAQSAQETAWGKSRVGRNGMFGIKADSSWTGETVMVPTWEVINGQTVYITDKFRDYPTVEASIEDHFKFLKANTRYEAAGVFDRLGDEHFFQSLQKAGYATDPNYARNLMAVRDTVINYFLPRLNANGQPPAPPPPRLMLTGDRGEDVRRLQDALQREGYYVGAAGADGWFGVNTYNAVCAFQKAKKLTVDGVVGEQTRKELKL